MSAEGIEKPIYSLLWIVSTLEELILIYTIRTNLKCSYETSQDTLHTCTNRKATSPRANIYSTSFSDFLKLTQAAF